MVGGIGSFAGAYCGMAAAQTVVLGEDRDPRDRVKTLAEEFAAAVKANTARMLKGLNALTDEEKAEKIAEFRAKFEPMDGTEEEMEYFRQMLAKFEKMLHNISYMQHTEGLVVTSNENNENNRAENNENNDKNETTFPFREFARLNHYSTARAVG